MLLHVVYSLVHAYRTSFLIGTEVRVTQHGHHRSVVEETYGLVGQTGDVYQGFGIRMAVDQCVGQEVSTFLGVQYVHGAEVGVTGLYADDFFGHLDGIAVFGVQSGDESVGFACLYHHHTEVVAFEHLVVGFFVGDTFACAFFGQDTCIAFAARRFVGMAQVDNLDTFQTEVELLGEFFDSFVVT